MDFKIAGVSLYYIISWFFIYSFFGWIWESAYVSVKKKKLVNRGFISGPLCTIYGVGAVSIYLILRPFEGNPVILYLGGVLTATLLEYITGWLMEAIFHTRWWDYSKRKWNLRGYICLGSSVAWGFFTLLLFYVLQPFVAWMTQLCPARTGKLLLLLVFGLYIADLTSSVLAAFGLSKAFGRVEDMLEDLTAYLQDSRLYATREEIRDKLENARNYRRLQEAGERLSLRKQEFLERFESLVKESPMPDAQAYREKRRELEQRLDEFTKKYLDIRKRQGAIKHRMLRAYPDLKKHFKSYRDRLQERKNGRQR